MRKRIEGLQKALILCAMWGCAAERVAASKETSRPPSSLTPSTPWLSRPPATAPSQIVAPGPHKPVLVDFWASWCRPCQMLDEITFKDPRVKRALARFDIRRVDASEPTPEVERAAQRYRVASLPTLVFIDSYGRVMERPRIAQFVSPDVMLRVLAQVP